MESFLEKIASLVIFTTAAFIASVVFIVMAHQFSAAIATLFILPLAIIALLVAADLISNKKGNIWNTKL